MIALDHIRTILATDCGSTTTKAILIERINGSYRLTSRGEAPTTVEAPYDDVTIGVANATREIEELTKRTILDRDGRMITPTNADGHGVDIYLSTSSAGGGLQMTVAGVVRAMSAESAERAALGAGAIVIDVVAINDGRKDHEKIARIRALRPDMILMAGGTDGGTQTHLVELAELLRSADPKPRLGAGLPIPVIYAGNIDAAESVKSLIGDVVSFRAVPNVRPDMATENLAPARDAIHDLFLEHVMQQAPGYSRLMEWTDADIISTPNAVGLIMEAVAHERKIDVLGVDIGGATTDVFSVFDGTFNRSVSANLGMSYSICNVLVEAGLSQISRWLTFQSDEVVLRNQLRNKMIRPTTIPQTLRDLALEHAVAREALHRAFSHHKSLARSLVGVRAAGNVEFEREATGQSLVKLFALNLIIGSGGVLSHAPHRAQAMHIMLDAFEPQGVTMLAVDSIFMMPHLGVLSQTLPEAATEVFDRDCLIKLGDVVSPVGIAPTNAQCLNVEIEGMAPFAVSVGKLQLVNVPSGEMRRARLTPSKRFDLGNGRGVPLDCTLEGGEVGLVIDTRGRPLQIATDREQRRLQMVSWTQAMGLTPAE